MPRFYFTISTVPYRFNEKKTRLQTQTDLYQLSLFLPFVRQRSA